MKLIYAEDFIRKLKEDRSEFVSVSYLEKLLDKPELSVDLYDIIKELEYERDKYGICPFKTDSDYDEGASYAYGEAAEMLKEALNQYRIADYDGTGMLEIQKLDSGKRFQSDAEAAIQAAEDGIKLIPVEELPENFGRKYLGWLDTKENREKIKAYCQAG